MVRAIAFVVFFVSIFQLHGRDLSTVLCVKEEYVIPLFTSQPTGMTFNHTRLRQWNIHTVRVSTFIRDHKVAEFENGQQRISNVFHLSNGTKSKQQEPTFTYTFTIRAKYINRTSLHYSVEMFSTSGHVRRLNCSITLTVAQPRRLIDKIFKASLPFVIIFISIQMGVLLDTKVLKELVRRPIQVSIGFVCQYGLMPPLAWAITKIFRYEPLYGLGLFVVGCCPGGWASNQWTVLFDGDLNLSVFMSFASTVASFFMMPIWLYTLGQSAYLQQLKIRIPFFNLAQSLGTIIGPLAVGMLLVYCIPKLKPLVTRIVKPVLLILLLYFFVFGAFVNFYLFRYIDLRTALTAPLLPWLGFLLGSCVAWVCRQDWPRIKTIGIETGIQNVGIAFIVLLYSLPAPENSQACVMPLIVAYLCTQPFYIILIYRFIRRKFSKSEKPVRHASVDALSKTTRQLTEDGNEEADDNASTPMAVPVAAAGISPNVEPVKV